MRTVALVAQSPGSGRTSLALSLALAAAGAGVSTLALDLDPATPLIARLEERFGDPEDPAAHLNLPHRLSVRRPRPASLHRFLGDVLDRDLHELAIFDHAGGLGEDADDVLALADLTLVPVRGDQLALRAAQAAATRLLHARHGPFAFVAVGPRAAEAVPVLRELGDVAGVLGEDALLGSVMRLLDRRPAKNHAKIIADVIEPAAARAQMDERKAARIAAGTFRNAAQIRADAAAKKAAGQPQSGRRPASTSSAPMRRTAARLSPVSAA